MIDLIISPLVCFRYHKVMGKVKKGFGLTGQLKQRKKPTKNAEQLFVQGVSQKET